MMFYEEIEFKETSIGKIPTEWKTVRLEEVGTLTDGDWILKEHYTKDGVRLIQIGDIGLGDFLDKSDRYISPSKAKALNCKFIREGDILISRMPDPIGRACLAPKLSCPAIVAVDITIFRVQEDRIFPMFITNILNFNKTLQRIKMFSSGATRLRISRRNLEKIPIPIPQLLEQKKIVEVLSVVDLAIEKVDEVIAKTERLKKGLMQELLTKGIGHKEFKDTKIGKTPKEWEVVRIGDKITLQRGYDLPEKQRREGPFPVIGSNGIVGYHDEFRVEGPGVIVGRSGTLGRVYYYEDSFWPLNTSLYVKQFKNCHRKFVFYLLQHIDLRQFSAGTSVPTLNRNLVHPAKTVFPKNINEQERIAEILTLVDKKLEIEKNEKVKLERIKVGLTDLLLTGKVRVKVAD